MKIHFKSFSLEVNVGVDVIQGKLLKMIGIRPMAPVLNTGPLEVSEHEMLSFSVRKEIIKNDNSLEVILLTKVVEYEFLSDFITNSQSRIIILPLFRHALITDK